jgi:uridine kinase
MSKIIGICGPSGSGKTTISSLLAKELVCDVISLDNYFLLDTPFKKYGEQGKDLELPENTDWNTLNKLVSGLKADKTVKTREISWDTNSYTESDFTPNNIVIIEGFLLLHDERIVQSLDLSVYIDIPDEVGLERRLAREGSNENKQWFLDVTFPEYAQRRDVFKNRADIVLNGEESVDDNVDILIKKIHKFY